MRFAHQAQRTTLSVELSEVSESLDIFEQNYNGDKTRTRALGAGLGAWAWGLELCRLELGVRSF